MLRPCRPRTRCRVQSRGSSRRRPRPRRASTHCRSWAGSGTGTPPSCAARPAAAGTPSAPALRQPSGAGSGRSWVLGRGPMWKSVCALAARHPTAGGQRQRADGRGSSSRTRPDVDCARSMLRLARRHRLVHLKRAAAWWAAAAAAANSGKGYLLRNNCSFCQSSSACRGRQKARGGSRGRACFLAGRLGSVPLLIALPEPDEVATGCLGTNGEPARPA